MLLTLKSLFGTYIGMAEIKCITVADQINAVNKAVISLFQKDRPVPNNGRIPMLYDELALKPVVLFMGINPSYSVTATNIFLKNASAVGEWDEGNECTDATFEFRSLSEDDCKKLKKIQRLAKSFHPYFTYFRNVGEAISLSLWHDKKPHQLSESQQYWEHIDLFFSRTRNRHKLDDEREFVERDKKVTEFGERQIYFTKQLIEIIKPQNIVVANRDVADIFKRCFLTAYSKKDGWGQLNFGSGARVFLSGHWASGRLDDYTANIIASYLRCHMLLDSK